MVYHCPEMEAFLQRDIPIAHSTQAITTQKLIVIFKVLISKLVAQW